MMQEWSCTDVEWIDMSAAPSQVTTRTRQIKFDTKEPLVQELAHFVQVVRDGAVPVVSIDDGIRAVELAISAMDSARLGLPVKLE